MWKPPLLCPSPLQGPLRSREQPRGGSALLSPRPVLGSELRRAVSLILRAGCQQETSTFWKVSVWWKLPRCDAREPCARPALVPEASSRGEWSVWGHGGPRPHVSHKSQGDSVQTRTDLLRHHQGGRATALTSQTNAAKVPAQRNHRCFWEEKQANKTAASFLQTDRTAVQRPRLHHPEQRLSGCGSRACGPLSSRTRQCFLTMRHV